MATLTQEIQESYEQATGGWDTADWTHENGEENGEPLYCEGNNPDGCSTCAAAEKDAAEAERLAAIALAAAKAGNWTLAENAATAAHSLEVAYGDAPVWGGFYRAICEREH